MGRKLLVGLSFLLAMGSLFALVLAMPSHSTASGVGQFQARTVPTDWYSVTVDSAGDVGRWTSLALDSTDSPHISYGDSVNHTLKYAWLSGDTWYSTTVDSIGNLTRKTSLALDSADQPHIAYYESDSDVLKYAWLSDTIWYSTTVDSSSDVGMYVSLALDSSDYPHISYYDNANFVLKYAWLSDTVWYSTTVDHSADVGMWTSLALDSADEPRIGYYDNTSDTLKYAWLDGAVWFSATVDSSDRMGGNISLALDSLDRPHISYCTYGCAPFKYAWLSDTVWYSTTVDTRGEYGSLALDESDNPFISYHDTSSADLKFAWLDDATWTNAVVDPDGTTGQYTSLALDSRGNPHISYYAAESYSNLKYAWGSVTEFVYLPLILQDFAILGNTDFELGPVGWTEYSSNGWALITFRPKQGEVELPPHSGDWVAWLGGGDNEVAAISQRATVVADRPHFAYWHWIGSLEAICGRDVAMVRVNGITVDGYDLCDATETGGWVQYSVDLSSYVGQTVEIEIRAETDNSDLDKDDFSNLFVDDVSFEANPVRRLNSAQTNLSGDSADALEKTD